LKLHIRSPRVHVPSAEDAPTTATFSVKAQSGDSDRFPMTVPPNPGPLDGRGHAVTLGPQSCPSRHRCLRD
jgi:hypothetical protein